MEFSKKIKERLEQYQDMQLANLSIRAGNEAKLNEDIAEINRLKDEVVKLAKSGKTADIIKLKHQIDDLQFEIDTLTDAIKTAPEQSAEYTADDLRNLWNDALAETEKEVQRNRAALVEVKKKAVEAFIRTAEDYNQLMEFRRSIKELMPEFQKYHYLRTYGLSPLPTMNSFNLEFSPDCMNVDRETLAFLNGFLNCVSFDS